MNKIQDARNAVYAAESNLRAAREALDEVLIKPSHAAQFLLDHFSSYGPTLKHDNPSQLAINLSNWSHDRHGFRAQGTCARLLKEHGFYLGCVISNDSYQVELRFFHQSFS